MELFVVIIILLSTAVITLAIMLGILSQRISTLSAGSKTQSLEGIINSNNKSLKEQAVILQKYGNKIQEIEKDARENIQNIGVIRFNPFKETGGSQSFAIALTDKDQNGVVISSLYARERMSVFAKPIRQGTSEYTLTEEEQAAITQSHK